MSSSRPPPVVVTGVAGFIGSHLAEALLLRGQPVVGVDNLDAYYPRVQKLRNLELLNTSSKLGGAAFTFLERDILDVQPQDIPAPSGVFHLAARAGVRASLQDPMAYHRTNAGGAAHMLELARAWGLSSVVQASSSSVYGEGTPPPFVETARADRPLSPYAASKRAAELYASAWSAAWGLRVVSLRFFTVYGPRQRPDLAIHHFARCALRGEPVELFGDGSTGRDYTYVSDIVEGLLAAGAHAPTLPRGSHEVFNLAGGRVVTLLEMVASLERALGVTLERRHVERSGVDMPLTSGDIRKAREVLHWAPRVGLDEGLARFAAWFRAEAP